MECPHCGGEVAAGDEPVVLCLGCAASLRIVDGRAVTTEPSAVQAPVDNEATDRAPSPPLHDAPVRAAGAGPSDETLRARSLTPAPLPPPPLSAEPNAPAAPIAPADDRTPAVPAPVKPAAHPTPTAVVAPLPSPSTPAKTSRLRRLLDRLLMR